MTLFSFSRCGAVTVLVWLVCLPLSFGRAPLKPELSDVSQESKIHQYDNTRTKRSQDNSPAQFHDAFSKDAVTWMPPALEPSDIGTTETTSMEQIFANMVSENESSVFDFNKADCDPVSEFTCGNGRCVPKLWRCDMVDDCGDNSDELPLICPHQNCRYGLVQCPGGPSGNCIGRRRFCDGTNDCGDNSDELPQNCAPCKPESDFTCKNNRCIHKRLRCDKEDDCGDNSDEDQELCGGIFCDDSEFQCRNAKCVKLSWRCDGEDDCGDNSDEINCQVVNFTERNNADHRNETTTDPLLSEPYTSSNLAINKTTDVN